jgi:biopolymer transport protein ExbD
VRRFSQRNSLVTLNEINITPLLDLAFVLLIIFIITRPLLEQNIDMNLPKGGAPDLRNIDRRNIKTVEITQHGDYFIAGHHFTTAALERELVNTFRQNPKLIVDIRGDGRTSWGGVVEVIDTCMRNKITQFSVRTAPVDHK